MVPILVGLWLCSGCKAELPEQLAMDGSADLPCSIYADLLVAYSPPNSEGSSDEGLRALGAPDGTGVELVTGATLTVSFVGLGEVRDTNGSMDLRIHGTLSEDGTVQVLGAPALDDFVNLGGLTVNPNGVPNEFEIELNVARLRSVSTLQFIGVINESGVGGTATIDAIEALGDNQCPNS